MPNFRPEPWNQRDPWEKPSATINVNATTKTEHECGTCGLRRHVRFLKPTRVPGIGTVYRCKRCPA